MNILKIYAVVLFMSLVVGCQPIQSQDIVLTEEDKTLFEKEKAVLSQLPLKDKSTGELAKEVGESFLGLPYVAQTLEVGDEEALVVNLRGMDCTTYVENVVAFSKFRQSENQVFEDYTNWLRKIRYREGVLNGYASRLHYFSDWIEDNERKGILKNITQEIGGKPLRKQLDFMSTHRSSYPRLKDDLTYQQIKEVEGNLKGRDLYYIPKEEIVKVESQIKDGDIIAITTVIGGLDITHVGFAVKKEDGRVYLMHASLSGSVIVSDIPLADYMKKFKRNTGIMVCRLL